MKVIKRLSSVILIILICFTTLIPVTAFASEQPQTTQETIEFVIQPNSDNENVSILANVDNTFNVNMQHTGSSRAYTGNYIRYSIEITDINGNPVDNILAVRFFDSATNTLRRENQFWANGSIYAIQDIPINSGQYYYFKYLLAYGTQRTLRVRMTITSYS